ncbi:hypothetical protein L596_005722 [Steinernema carpocapsae]|uniref:Uncharacterized protein n=1 Tax=Steinernema carpocapsae TaxID=34508 RepID=A0A4U8V071_STECR|nr:hypothetical protein L596_005722 [Steinernema carpocapsae]
MATSQPTPLVPIPISRATSPRASSSLMLGCFRKVPARLRRATVDRPTTPSWKWLIGGVLRPRGRGGGTQEELWLGSTDCWLGNGETSGESAGRVRQCETGSANIDNPTAAASAVAVATKIAQPPPERRKRGGGEEGRGEERGSLFLARGNAAAAAIK